MSCNGRHRRIPFGFDSKDSSCVRVVQVGNSYPHCCTVGSDADNSDYSVNLVCEICQSKIKFTACLFCPLLACYVVKSLVSGLFADSHLLSWDHSKLY